MNVKIEENLVISPEGRITAENAKQLESEIQEIINKHPGLTPTFDLERVEYISSAGLRMFLVFSKQFKEKLTIRNVLPEIYEVFSVTGFTSIMNVEKKLRQISVEGCKVLGKGAGGTVYRLDGETIVKVYSGPNPKQEIEEGQAKAKYALIRGVDAVFQLHDLLLLLLDALLHPLHLLLLFLALQIGEFGRDIRSCACGSIRGRRKNEGGRRIAL